LIYHEYQGRLAEKLCKISGLDRAFFTKQRNGIDRRMSEVRTPHTPGRSSACFRSISRFMAHVRCLVGNRTEAIPRAIRTAGAWFRFCQFDDTDDLERKLTDEVCAVLIETIQGEGGIRPISEQFYRAPVNLRKGGGCSDHG